jgi:uncharacterized protein (UPF0332 family)
VARSRLFNPLSFLDLAKRLNHDDEAELRTAISRAYYAVHLRTQQSLEAQGRISTGEKHTHSDIWVALGRIHWKAGNRLSTMYRARVRADYRLGAEVDELRIDLEESVENAKYIAEVGAGSWSTLPQ